MEVCVGQIINQGFGLKPRLITLSLRTRRPDTYLPFGLSMVIKRAEASH
jgi:hypothetical protein